MNNKLLFEFKVDKASNRIFVNREFAASQDLVWDAFTKPEILDQWWAPKPWTSKTKVSDFVVGGKRIYAMISPEGAAHWSIQEYTAIQPITNFKYLDSFADENEVVHQEMPASEWNLDFSKQEGQTLVCITIQHDSLASLEQIIQMGFQGGFTMTLAYLDELLVNLSKDK